MNNACIQRKPLVDSANLLKRVFAVFDLLDGCVLASHDPIPVAGAGIYSTVFRANVNIAPSIRNLDPAFFNSTKGNSSIYTIQQPEPTINSSSNDGTHGTFYYLKPGGIVYYVTFNTTAHEGTCKNNMDMLFALAEMKHLDLPEARAAAVDMAKQRISDPGVGWAEHADLSEAIRKITMAQNAAVGYSAAEAAAAAVAVVAEEAAASVAEAAEVAAANTAAASAAVEAAAVVAAADTVKAAAVVAEAAGVAAANTAAASAAVEAAAEVAAADTVEAAAVVAQAAEVAAANTAAASAAVEAAAEVAAAAVAEAAAVAAANTAAASAAVEEAAAAAAEAVAEAVGAAEEALNPKP